MICPKTNGSCKHKACITMCKDAPNLYAKADRVKTLRPERIFIQEIKMEMSNLESAVSYRDNRIESLSVELEHMRIQRSLAITKLERRTKILKLHQS